MIPRDLCLANSNYIYVTSNPNVELVQYGMGIQYRLKARKQKPDAEQRKRDFSLQMDAPLCLCPHELESTRRSASGNGPCPGNKPVLYCVHNEPSRERRNWL